MKKFIVYDMGDEYLDRLTIIRESDKIGKNANGRYTYNALSSSINGLGVFQWTECIRGNHLGTKIPFESLDKELQKKINLAYH